MNNNDNYMNNNMNMNESLNAIGNDGFSDQCVIILVHAGMYEGLILSYGLSINLPFHYVIFS